MRERKRATNFPKGKFVRFTAPTIKQIEGLASTEHRTISNVIRVLVEEALAKRERSAA